MKNPADPFQRQIGKNFKKGSQGIFLNHFPSRRLAEVMGLTVLTDDRASFERAEREAFSTACRLAGV